MYLKHFGITISPFGMTPDPAFFYSGGQRGEILRALSYAVIHGDGFIKVIGEVGSGKTTLCRMLETVLPKHVRLVYLINPTLTAIEISYAIAAELGLDTTGKRRDEVIRELQVCLIQMHAEGMRVVLLIEEAQAMPLETLEEIRLFSNLETARHKLLQLVLFGQPELDKKLRKSALRQFQERIKYSFCIPPLAKNELNAYVAFRLRRAGYEGPALFSDRALRAIWSASNGVLRRIGLIAEKGLMAAFIDGKPNVHCSHITLSLQDCEFYRPSSLRKRANAAIVGIALLGIVVTLITQPIEWREFTAQLAIAPKAKQKNQNLPSQTVATVHDHNNISTDSYYTAKSKGRLEATEMWFSRANVNTYTIQLLLTQDDDLDKLGRLLEPISRLVRIEEIYVFKTNIGSKNRFGVTIGSFNDAVTAQIEAQRLMRDLHIQPFVRTIGSVVEETAILESRDQ